MRYKAEQQDMINEVDAEGNESIDHQSASD
jgi:hypothetical protein